MTRANSVAENILAAQCLDLGLSGIQRMGDGTVVAYLRDTQYCFGWDVTHQEAVLLGRSGPAVYNVVSEAA